MLLSGIVQSLITKMIAPTVLTLVLLLASTFSLSTSHYIMDYADAVETEYAEFLADPGQIYERYPFDVFVAKRSNINNPFLKILKRIDLTPSKCIIRRLNSSGMTLTSAVMSHEINTFPCVR